MNTISVLPWAIYVLPQNLALVQSEFEELGYPRDDR